MYADFADMNSFGLGGVPSSNSGFYFYHAYKQVTKMYLQHCSGYNGYCFPFFDRCQCECRLKTLFSQYMFRAVIWPKACLIHVESIPTVYRQPLELFQEVLNMRFPWVCSQRQIWLRKHLLIFLVQYLGSCVKTFTTSRSLLSRFFLICGSNLTAPQTGTL